jgi:uncharacterized DUF497 family protein
MGALSGGEVKGRINKKLHGLYFDEILPAFDDPCLLELYDEAHSDFAETRFKDLAAIQDFIILYLSYTEPVRQSGPR